ncbi:anhydro-N-acetylmuramic acid kinase [Flavobacteriaceae bacterium MHTCC 0001]
MGERKYWVVGVMSGTSLDGIDLVYTSIFNKNNKWYYKILCSETIHYTNAWLDTLKDLVHFAIEDINEIDTKYTVLLSEIIKAFIKKHNIEIIDAICSHGHTALHKPNEGYTYQIGNQSQLAKLLGKTVVCDFRVQDVEFGGEGAPLVPIGDKLLFSEYDFCLNLGGFANISFDMDDNRVAYDICPVNIVLNYYARQLKLYYDEDGAIAATGSVDMALLDALNQLDFYDQAPPKSLGLEWVQSKIFPLIDSFQIKTEDILCTFCEHIAIKISNEIHKKANASVLITGGGAYNIYLMSRLKNYCENDIVIPNKHLVEFKEALIFAFLGVLKLRNEINCLKSVTGARENHSSGIIYQP